MFDHPFTIALDGPAAAGKGTIGRALAKQFQVPHLDTGLLYRAVGYKATLGRDPLAAARALDGDDFADPTVLRTREAGEAASQIAADPAIRAALLDFQRNFARQKGGAVLDGRDIGTVVVPEAEAKLFVTASDAVRARRRHRELVAMRPDLTLGEVAEDLRIRDARDAGRTDAPLKKATDALLLDTTELSIDAAVAEAVRFIEQKRAEISVSK